MPKSVAKKVVREILELRLTFFDILSMTFIPVMELPPGTSHDAMGGGLNSFPGLLRWVLSPKPFGWFIV